MTANRPHGIIKDFRIASEEYLQLIVQDLGLDAPLHSLKYLQYVYGKEKKDPTVDALLFDLHYMAHRAGLHNDLILSGFAADDPAIPPLFAELVRKKLPARDNNPLGVSLAALFGKICPPNLPSNKGTFSLISARQPRFPQAPGTVIVGEGGGFLLGYAENGIPPQNSTANCAVLVPKDEGQPLEEYIRNAQSMVAEIVARVPEAFVVPCTENGLLTDALALREDLLLFSDCLPSAEGAPEAVVDSYAPGFLIALPQASAEYVRDFARSRGFRANIPLVLRDGTDSILIHSQNAPLSLTRAHLRSLSSDVGFRLKAEAGPSVDAIPLPFSGNGAPVDAFSLRGTVYDAFRQICSPDCAFAFALRVNWQAADTVPLLISLDAALSAFPAQIAASCTEPADRTELIVFRMHGTGTPSAAPGIS